MPWWVWLLAGASAAVPVGLALTVRRMKGRLPTMPVEEYLGEVRDEEVRAAVADVVRRVGVVPENFRVVCTESLGPMVCGTQRGAVVLMPHLLMRMMDPDAPLSLSGVRDDGSEVPVYEGTVGAMAEEDRRRAIRHLGLLLPARREIEYVLGHEAAHLLHQDTYRTALAGLVSLPLAHVSIKLFNRVSHSFFPRLMVVGTITHMALAAFFSSLTVAAVGMYEEMEADRESARKLHCGREAVALVEKKILLNLQQRAAGSWRITPRGNDLLNFTHPPLSVQHRYLSAIALEQAAADGDRAGTGAHGAAVEGNAAAIQQ